MVLLIYYEVTMQCFSINYCIAMACINVVLGYRIWGFIKGLHFDAFLRHEHMVFMKNVIVCVMLGDIFKVGGKIPIGWIKSMAMAVSYGYSKTLEIRFDSIPCF